MSEYTNNLTAEQIIRYIANDYVELSHDKVSWQRDDHMKICREWLVNLADKEQAGDLCIECGKLAVWMRYTQFSGDHPFCQEHAEEESDFGENDSYKDWAKIVEKE